jgi:hypothetical protein
VFNWVELRRGRLPGDPALGDASPMAEQRRVVVGVTGAGGTRLAGVLLNKLVDDERVGHVDVMVSAAHTAS